MVQDFGDFEVVVQHKPESGSVTIVQIPEKLANYLSANVERALTSPDHELVIKAADEKRAKLLTSYARAWGMQQTPRLRITKLPNGKRAPENHARLSVVLDEEVPEQNRPGRRKVSAAK